MVPWKTDWGLPVLDRTSTAQALLCLLLFYPCLVFAINSTTAHNVTDSQDFHDALRNTSMSVLLLKGDVELRNYYGWFLPSNNEEMIRKKGSLEVSSGLGESHPRPRWDLDSHPIHRMIPRRFTLTSHRVHYTNVDVAPGSTVDNLENGTVIFEDCIIEVFIKKRSGRTIASRWKYLRALLEDPSSVPLKTGTKVAPLWCLRNEDISCPIGGIHFEQADFQWNANYTWKLQNTLIKFVQKSESAIAISDAFLSAIEDMKNYIYIPFNLALDFGVCNKAPVVTNTTIYDPNRSLPPNLVINFQERLYGCLEVHGELTIRVADFILRNVFSENGWPVVFPFLYSDSGATIVLENVNIEMDTSSEFKNKTLDRMARSIRNRTRPEGLGQGEQRLTVWQEDDCKHYLLQSRDCRVNEICPEEAQCPSGAIFIEDAAFEVVKGDGNDDLGIGMRYHIRHSLITVVPGELPPALNTGIKNQTIPQDDETEQSLRIETTSKSPGTVIVFSVLVTVIGLMCLVLLVCGVLTYRRGVPARAPLQRDSPSPPSSPKFTIKAQFDGDPINLAAEVACEALAVKELEIYQNYQQTANKLLGSVTLGPLIGAGSFGKVFKATWNGAAVAVKVVVHDGLSYLGTSAEREASLSSDLHHPNIVQTFLQTTREIKTEDLLRTPSNDEGCSFLNQAASSGEQSVALNVDRGGAGYFNLDELVHDQLGAGGGPIQDPFGNIDSQDLTEKSGDSEQELGDRKETWMIQEFCDMGSLEKAIRKGKFVRNEQLDMVLVVETCVDICRGMIYLNDRNIIHGDLKSSNILLNGSLHEEKGFIAKVADFGLSRQLGMHASHIKTQTTGTVTHMPPELFKEEKMTAASDVYSFGIVMWELVSKESPLEGVPHFLIIKKIIYDNWRPTFAEGTPTCYVQLAQCCWAEDSTQRPVIQQVLTQLEEMRQLFLEEEIASVHSIA